MKNSRLETIKSLKISSKRSNLDLSKIKSTDINILLNKVRLDQKNDLKKKFLYFLLIVSFILIISFITFI